jgi:C-terminal processing protease CtpA/Prc
VGLTLKAVGGSYFVAAIAMQNGKPTVDGVLPGDKLIKIDGLSTQTATWGTLFSALHGKPGEFHTLLLERNGKQLTARARITAF